MRKYIFLFGILSLLTMSSCDSKYSAIENAVYFGEAQTSNSKSITVSADGANTELYASLAHPTDNDVAVTVAVDESVLERYNLRNGSNYLPLPEKFYKIGGDRIVIDAGKVKSAMMPVDILPFDETLEVSEKYAIPVRLVSPEGVDLLESASEMIILCDRLINTKIFRINGGTGNVAETDGSLESISLYQWTIEFLSYCDSYKLNAHNLEFLDDSTPKQKVSFFCRYGEYDHPKDEIQFKIIDIPFYGPTKYSPQKWQHVAITCDGSVVKLYKDGVLDMTVDYPEPGKPTVVKTFCTRQGNTGSMSELRVWNVARSQVEIAGNMYAVNPKSKGLLHYWKMDDGSGSSFKDYTGGRDMTIKKSSGTWQDQIFPPEQ